MVEKIETTWKNSSKSSKRRSFHWKNQSMLTKRNDLSWIAFSQVDRVRRHKGLVAATRGSNKIRSFFLSLSTHYTFSRLTLLYLQHERDSGYRRRNLLATQNRRL